MKIGLKIICLFMVVFLAVGCMNFNTNMTVHSDKSVDIQMSMEMNLLDFANNMMAEDGFWQAIVDQIVTDGCATSCPYDESSTEYTTCMNVCIEEAGSPEKPSESEIKEYLDSYFSSGEFNEEEFFSSEDKEELESKGYTVDTILDEENYSYQVRISQHFDSIDEVSSTSLDTVRLEDVFNGDTNNIFFLKKDNNTYQANYTWTMNNDDIDQNIDIDMNDIITFSYEVTLPNAAISNNATLVSSDSKTLTWNLDLNENSNVNYEFSFNSNNSSESSDVSNNTLKIVSICLIAGGSIGLVIAIVVFMKKRKNNA